MKQFFVVFTVIFICCAKVVGQVYHDYSPNVSLYDSTDLNLDTDATNDVKLTRQTTSRLVAGNPITTAYVYLTVSPDYLVAMNSQSTVRLFNEGDLIKTNDLDWEMGKQTIFINGEIYGGSKLDGRPGYILVKNRNTDTIYSLRVVGFSPYSTNYPSFLTSFYAEPNQQELIAGEHVNNRIENLSLSVNTNNLLTISYETALAPRNLVSSAKAYIISKGFNFNYSDTINSHGDFAVSFTDNQPYTTYNVSKSVSEVKDVFGNMLKSDSVYAVVLVYYDSLGKVFSQQSNYYTIRKAGISAKFLSAAKQLQSDGSYQLTGTIAVKDTLGINKSYRLLVSKPQDKPIADKILEYTSYFVNQNILSINTLNLRYLNGELVNTQDTISLFIFSIPDSAKGFTLPAISDNSPSLILTTPFQSSLNQVHYINGCDEKLSQLVCIRKDSSYNLPETSRLFFIPNDSIFPVSIELFESSEFYTTVVGNNTSEDSLMVDLEIIKDIFGKSLQLQINYQLWYYVPVNIPKNDIPTKLFAGFLDLDPNGEFGMQGFVKPQFKITALSVDTCVGARNSAVVPIYLNETLAFEANLLYSTSPSHNSISISLKSKNGYQLSGENSQAITYPTSFSYSPDLPFSDSSMLLYSYYASIVPNSSKEFKTPHKTLFFKNDNTVGWLSIKHAAGSCLAIDTAAIQLKWKEVNFNSELYCSTLVSVDTNFGSDLVVYPNPADKLLHVVGSESINSIFVYDVMGKQILAAELKTNQDNGIKLDTSTWVPGIYSIVLKGAKNQLITKVVVSH